MTTVYGKSYFDIINSYLHTVWKKSPVSSISEHERELWLNTTLSGSLPKVICVRCMYPVQGAGMTTRAMTVFIVFRSKADKHDFLKHSYKSKKHTSKKTKTKKNTKHIMQRFDKCILKQKSKLLHCPHPKAICRYNQMFAQFSYILVIYLRYLKCRIRLLSITASVDKPKRSTQRVTASFFKTYGELQLSSVMWHLWALPDYHENRFYCLVD